LRIALVLVSGRLALAVSVLVILDGPAFTAFIEIYAAGSVGAAAFLGEGLLGLVFGSFQRAALLIVSTLRN
jgi:hypothetical protein